MVKRLFGVGLLAFSVAALLDSGVLAGEGTGTLMFVVKPFETEVKLKKNIQKQLEHGGIEWGVNGDTIVVTLVASKYINAEFPYLTRYGTSKKIELPAGSYPLTCVGYIHDSNSRDIDKVLSASAFFNEDVLTVEILANKVTTLEVSPMVKKQAHSSFLVKVKVFMPDLTVKIIEGDLVVDEAIINHRTERSVAWDDYSGPLKFEK
jgi:hypothetical protein